MSIALRKIKDPNFCRIGQSLPGDPKDAIAILNFSAKIGSRMTWAYPIHPEVFDPLHEDWSSLDNFQRTHVR